MKSRKTDTNEDATFPPSPVAASELLVPITSWPEMFRETAVTGVEFDLFWYDSVEKGVAYFFSWRGEPRATVLVVWSDSGPTHIECRKVGDTVTSESESMSIIAEVTQLFRSAGFWRNGTDH